MSKYDYDLTGNVLSDREKVNQALNDSSLSYDEKQRIVNQHNHLNLDNAKMPMSRDEYEIKETLNKYVITSSGTASTSGSTYSHTIYRSTEDKFKLCDAKLFTLKRRNKELFALVDPLKYSINPFGAKKRQAKYESLPVETRVLYEELDAQRRELEKELRELKAQLKKERSGDSDDNCACNGSGGCY